MSLYRAVLLALVVVGGALVATVPTGATTPATQETTHDAEATPEVAEPTRVGDGLTAARPTNATDAAATDTAAADTTATNDTTANSSLGTDISSFMQSSAAEVDGAVETGMWSAAFNDTDNQSVRVELVETKTTSLREELAELRQRRADLVTEREEGNLSQTAYKAKVSRLLGEIDALRSAIDATTNRAESVNANVETLGSLRSETDNLTGPEIAAVARNVTGVGNGERGPPNGVGAGNGNGVGEGNGVGNGNGNGAGAGNGNGNAANAAKGATNGTTPGNAGEGNSGGNGVGNGNAGENGANGDDARKGNDAGKGEGLSDAGNETGVGNGVAGAGNGTDATNGTRGASGDAGNSLVTTGFLDRVSTAFAAGTGPFSDRGFTAF
jgi:hypothetical protein